MVEGIKPDAGKLVEAVNVPLAEGSEAVLSNTYSNPFMPAMLSQFKLALLLFTPVAASPVGLLQPVGTG